MSRQNRGNVISALIAVLIVLVVALAGVDASTGPAPRLQSSTSTPTLTPCDEDAEDNCFDIRDDLTASAEASATAQASITPGSRTPTTTRTVTVTGTPPTGTPTRTGTATAGSPTSTARATPTRTLSPQPTAPIPTPTTIEVPEDALTCAPGVPVVLGGSGPPRAAFLLYFGQRIVGGGSVDPYGKFSTTLIVGGERAGVYQVTVRLRGSQDVLREVSCAVPPTTPTPLPRAPGTR
jgi:hypothetical protein